MAWSAALVPIALVSFTMLVLTVRGKETCAPQEAGSTALLHVQLSHHSRIRVEEDQLSSNSSNDTASRGNHSTNTTQASLNIIAAVDACLEPRRQAAAGDPATLDRLEFVRVAEILSRLVRANLSVTVLGDGYSDDAEMISAAQMAGHDAAEVLVRQEFEAETMEALSGHNLSHHAIEHFTKKIAKMVHMCSNGTVANETSITSIESVILNSAESGHMLFEEAEVAMDIALYVQGLCQSEVLDIDFFVGSFGDNTSECNALMLASTSVHVNKQLSKFDYYAKSALVLHDEHNNLAHHFAQQLHPATRSTIAAVSMETLIHNASMFHAENRARMARLRYLDRTYYEKAHGQSMDKYCDMNAELASAQPEHWIIQSPEIQAYAECLCTKRKPALVCDAEHSEPLAKIRPQVQRKMEEVGQRFHSLLQLDTGTGKPVGLGPCQDSKGKTEAVSCSLCVNGNCIEPGGSSLDVFAAIKELLNFKSACMTGTCTPCMGVKPGDPIQFKLNLGVDGACGNQAALFSSFNLFASVEMCIGGVLGEAADTMGWSTCKELGSVSYYPFINKLHLTINLPIPLPMPLGVRATLSANLNLGDLTGAVTNYCGTKGAAGEYRCLKDMYDARGVTSIGLSVEVLMGIRVPLLGEIGKWVQVLSFGFAEKDNSRKLAMNKAGVTIVHIGPSPHSSYKCGRAFSGVNCEAHAGRKGYRVNEDWRDANDQIGIWRPTLLYPITSRSLCVRREDAVHDQHGWAMNLEVACRVDNSNLGVIVPIGSSSTRTKCVLPDEPVSCKNNAGDKDLRMGFEVVNDDFWIYGSGERICARRDDHHGGWGMNLQLECEPTNGAPVDYTVRTVHIGHSYANTKCVLVPQTYECDASAGDDANRVNDDCRNCGNRFFVSVNGGWVCARRLDHHQGWGLNLQIHCKDFGVAREVVRVNIGSSSHNSKCVTASKSVLCASWAGNHGMRLNTDGGWGDAFAITSSGSRVCARRTDQTGGWGMNLQIDCEA
ncbi:unnamed protein product [Symbiodinium necroappetens]|uniref:Uncharacterized protein n=1 Tax=Symbiodinium necroappetens TaxID=1628268 RepID=A0A812VUT8_9DINO|nr:unnamed protein product [Symbiodinium necroappetens]